MLLACDFTMPKFPQFALTHLNENEFLLSLNISSLSFEENCLGNSSFGTFSRGQTLIKVSKGCSLTTKLFEIPTYTSVQRSVRVRPFTPRLHEDFLQQNISLFDADFSLLQHFKLKKLENESVLSHWPLHLGTAILILGVVIVALVTLRCLRPK